MIYINHGRLVIKALNRCNTKALKILQLLSLIFVFFCISNQSYAESFIRIESKIQLPISVVHAVLRSKNGVIWLATHEGLSRYDGAKSKNYQIIDSKGQKQIGISLLEHKDGRIWVISTNSLSLFDPKTETFQPAFLDENNKPIEVSITSINYFSTSTLLLKLKESESFAFMDIDSRKKIPSQFSNVATNKHEDYKIFYKIKSYEDELYWLSNNKKTIYHFDKNKNLQLYEFDAIPDDITFDAVYLTHEHFYLPSVKSKTLYLIERQSLNLVKTHKLPILDTKSATVINDLEVLPNGEIFISTAGEGLYHIANDKVQNHRNSIFDENSITSNMVRDIYQDKDHKIWIVGYHFMVNVFDTSNQFVTADNVVVDDGLYTKFSPFTVFEKSNYRYLGGREGLHRRRVGEYNQSDHIYELVSRDLIVRCIVEDQFSNIWVCGDKGLYLMTADGELSEKPYLTLPPGYNFVSSILAVDTTYYVFTRTGLYHFEINRHIDDINETSELSLIKSTPKLKGSIKNGVHYGQDDLFIADYNGNLVHFDLKSQSIEKQIPIGPKSTRVSQIHLDGDIIWIASNNGLYQYTIDNGEIQHFTFKKILQGNIIFLITQLKDDVLLLGSNRSLMMFDTTTLSTIKVPIKNLMPSKEFNTGAYFYKDNLIYMGGVRGLLTIDKSKYLEWIKSPYIDAPQILEVRAHAYPQNDTDVLYNNKALVYPHFVNTLTIDFSSLDLIVNDEIYYQQRLNNNQNWSDIQTKTNQIVIPNLHPDTYTFQLRASIDGINWSEQSEFNFSILNPWWKRWWAIVFYMLLITLIAVTFFQEHLKAIKYAILHHNDNELMNKLFDNATEGIFVIEKDKIIRTNKAFEDTFDFSAKTSKSLSVKYMIDNAICPTQAQQISNVLKDQAHWKGELEMTKKRGEKIFVDASIINLDFQSSQQVARFVCLLSDASKRKEYEEKLKNFGFYDQDTQLPNRNSFNLRLKALADEDKAYAFCYLELDDYKKVNEYYGYQIGTDLIKALVKQLRQEVESDEVHLYRLSEIEFGVLLHVLPLEKAQSIYKNTITKIMDLFKQPFSVDGSNVHLTVSIGVSLYPIHTNKTQEIFQYAYSALSQSKKMGGNRFTIFNQAMLNSNSNRVALESKLKEAIKKNLITPYIQPITNYKIGRIKGFEVLARWIDEDGTFINPEHFIHVAENTHVINDVFDTLFNKVIQYIPQLQKTYPFLEYVSFNLSPLQLYDFGFLHNILDTLKQYNIRQEFILLEITETALINDPAKALEAIQLIKSFGIKIALDDFGTGQSSLTHLREFATDIIKIDRSFVSTLPQSKKVRTIVESVVKLGSTLDIGIIVEGIETLEEIEFLKSIDANTYQGYYFSKPKPIEDFIQKEIRFD